jgi:type IV secretion system protein VirB10
MPSADEYRSLDLEDAARSGVARSSNVLGNTALIGVPLAALAFVGWLLYSWQHKDAKLMTAADKEEFNTQQYPGPGLPAERQSLDLGKMVVPPPPPPPAEPQVPPPPVAPPTALAAPPFPDAATQRSDDDEKRRSAEEERKKWERLRAGQLIADGGSTLSVNGAAAAAGGKDGSGVGAVAEEDGNRRFLATAGSAGVEKAVATKNDRIDALVAQGTMIRADLLTAIQSDLPGNVSAITREDVWSFDGRRVLIPAGTKLIGDYRSGITRGQTRIFVVWTRLLRDDGVSVQLGSIGTDDLGRAGQAGFVDQHYVERFGASILLSVIGGASQFIATLGQQSQLNNQQNNTQSFTDPVTGLTTTITSQPNQNLLNARQIGSQQISQSLTKLSEEALQDSINIPPTIYVDQGTRIVIFVKKDLDFSNFYPDPVKEALREIKHERQSRSR